MLRSRPLYLGSQRRSRWSHLLEHCMIIIDYVVTSGRWKVALFQLKTTRSPPLSDKSYRFPNFRRITPYPGYVLWTWISAFVYSRLCLLWNISVHSNEGPLESCIRPHPFFNWSMQWRWYSRRYEFLFTQFWSDASWPAVFADQRISPVMEMAKITRFLEVSNITCMNDPKSCNFREIKHYANSC